MEGDAFEGQASAASTLDLYISYEVISQQENNLRVIGKAEVDGKFQYTANGTLTDKKPAIVNSSGQAEQVFSTIQHLGDRVFVSDNNCNYVRSCYDSNSNRIVYIYQDTDNNTYGTAVVGEIIGDTISFGKPVVFNSSANTVNMNCEFNLSLIHI